MRTSQEFLEYVDRMIDVGVDKMESQSQFALIEMQSSSCKQNDNCETMLVPVAVNANDPERKNGPGN